MYCICLESSKLHLLLLCHFLQAQLWKPFRADNFLSRETMGLGSISSIISVLMVYHNFFQFLPMLKLTLGCLL